jgi:lipopolysaccharide transport system ATP-binding protein
MCGKQETLLEVGTGFHPELTGKENIFLNGAILGMRKPEIKKKLDEIVDFAGVAKYIDTPVKRYSSGMYVRLAFAVAAHLEPDILVVDEVLAVGDAEFQKKAIGKMQDVSRQGGRTVLFVSHNMASIQKLCSKAIVLENGKIKYVGNVSDGISNYLSTSNSSVKQILEDRKDRTGEGLIKFKDYNIYELSSKKKGISTIKSGDNIAIEFSFLGKVILNQVNLRIQFFDKENNLRFICNNLHSSKAFKTITPENKVMCNIPQFPLSKGSYYVNLRLRAGNFIQDEIEYAFEVNVENGDFFKTGFLPTTTKGVLINHQWKIS